MNQKLLKYIINSLVLFIFIAIAEVVHADDKQSLITIVPSFQEVILSNSESEKYVDIEIENTTNYDIVFNLSVLDIRQVDAQGNVGLVEKPSGGDNPYAWFIDVPNDVLIKSGELKTIVLKVKNSINLSPGGHYVAVVAKSSLQNSTENFQVYPALSTFLLVKKEGGEIYQLTLKKSLDIAFFKFDLPRRIALTFENTGNVHVRPYGLVELKDIFGNVIKKGIINESSQIILPAAQREYSVELNTFHFGFPFMFYNLQVSGHTDYGDVNFSESSSFLYISPYFIVCVVLILLTLILLRNKKKVKKNKNEKIQSLTNY